MKEVIVAVFGFLTALVWPSFIAVLVFYLFVAKKAPSRIAELFRPFRSVKMFGTEFVLGEEAARQIRASAAETFQSYRAKANAEYDRLAQVHSLQEKLERVLLEHVAPQLSETPKTWRCTIHVPDILFSESLYQLLDYFPLGSRRGRAKSTRFGIIGKAWRSGTSKIQGEVSTRPKELIDDWGMTREEAAGAGRGRQSFAAIVLRDEQDTRVGIFYINAEEKNAFESKDESLETIIEQSCKEHGINDSLRSLNKELSKSGPLIEIYQ